MHMHMNIYTRKSMICICMFTQKKEVVTSAIHSSDSHNSKTHVIQFVRIAIDTLYSARFYQIYMYHNDLD